MLVLSRHTGEEIWLDGGKVRIVIVSVIGGRVRVGIDAPPECKIIRRELATTGDPTVDHTPLVESKKLRGGL